MRIRKRQVPLPLSSHSPAPVSLSDPHLINRSWGVVQLNQTRILGTTPTAASVTATAKTISASQQNHSSLLMEDIIASGTTISQLDRQPSDHRFTQQKFGKATNGPDSSCSRWPNKRVDPVDFVLQEVLPMEDVKQQETDKSHYSRETAIGTGSETATEALPLSNPLQGVRAVDGRWCDGEKVFLLKKRKGSSELRVTEETAMESNKNMKTKMDNKCSTHNDGTAPEGGAAKSVVNVNGNRVRGTALLEGSRCSRVNGRGWRCGQQTLVGYSLCEHHLGKGRLKSMTSVRSRSSAASKRKKSTPDQTSTPPPSAATSYDCEREDDYDEDEMKPLPTRKKTMKLGMVKARSIISLLGQTNMDNVGSSTAILK